MFFCEIQNKRKSLSNFLAEILENSNIYLHSRIIAHYG